METSWKSLVMQNRTKLETICWLLLGLQILINYIARSSVMYLLVASIFMIVTFILLFVEREIKLHVLHITTIIFVLYSVILIFFGGAADANHSLSMVSTVCKNLILAIIIYSFLVYTQDTKKVLMTYIISSFISNLILLFIYRDTLLTGRLAFSWRENITYDFLGLELSTIGSNGIAFYSAIAFIFTLYLVTKEKKKYTYYVYMGLFLFTILATGSRKGILLLVVGTLITLLVLKKRRIKLIDGILALIITIIIYYLTNSIPILYEIIGSRLNSLINLLFTGETTDSSINTRLNLINYAVELFKQQPIQGHGLDAFRILSPFNGIVSDNNYLEILVSGGIIGFLIYYSYVVFVSYKFINLEKKNDLTKILFSLLVLILIMEFGSVTYYNRNYSLFYSIFFYSIYMNENKSSRLI